MSNMNSPITIRLERNSTNQQWGFRLQGSISNRLYLSVFTFAFNIYAIQVVAIFRSHYRFNWYVS